MPMEGVPDVNPAPEVPAEAQVSGGAAASSGAHLPVIVNLPACCLLGEPDTPCRNDRHALQPVEAPAEAPAAADAAADAEAQPQPDAAAEAPAADAPAEQAAAPGDAAAAPAEQPAAPAEPAVFRVAVSGLPADCKDEDVRALFDKVRTVLCLASFVHSSTL